MNEICFVVVGEQRGGLWVGRLRQRGEGGPTSVAFDWAWVLAREERRGDVLGFFHTHPVGDAAPSLRDLRTMQGWVDCFGKPLLCAIQSGPLLAGYVFDGSDRWPLSRIERFRPNLLVGVA